MYRLPLQTYKTIQGSWKSLYFLLSVEKYGSETIIFLQKNWEQKQLSNWNTEYRGSMVFYIKCCLVVKKKDSDNIASWKPNTSLEIEYIFPGARKSRI